MSSAGLSPFLLVLVGALLAWSPSSSVPGRRIRRMAGRPPARGWAAVLMPAKRPVAPSRGAVRRHVLAGVAGSAVAAMVGGGVVGVVAGCAVGVGADRLLAKRHPDAGADHGRGLERELPAACDLLAVCLAGGVPIAGALAAVATATREPISGELGRVAALYRWGAAPSRAWADAARELAPLGRILVRAGESGSSVVSALRALAADGRASARARAETAVQRAGVWVLAPLGVCFLPAFVCLGVLPLVLGIARQVFR